MFIIPTLLIIAALVFIHEFGHYVCARMTDTPMTKFSVGFGKRLFACSLIETLPDQTTEPSFLFTWTGVRGKESSKLLFASGSFKRNALRFLAWTMGSISWEIRAIPLGGFVDPQLSRDKPRFFRDSLVLLGGPAANLAFAVFLLALCHMYSRDLTFTASLHSSVESIGWMAYEILQFILHPFAKHQGELSGPIGILAMGKSILEHGWNAAGVFTASLSCSLGLMNLLVIPPLDGGQLLFVWIRSLTPVFGARLERVIAASGTLGLIVAAICVSVNDIVKLF